MTKAICVLAVVVGAPAAWAQPEVGATQEGPAIGEASPGGGGVATGSPRGETPGTPALAGLAPSPLVKAGEFQLSMGTGPTLSFFGPLGNAGGVAAVVPRPVRDSRGVITSIGVSLGIGYLLRRSIEPGALVDVEVTNYSSTFYGSNQTYGAASFAPFLKFNTWLRDRFNPFGEVYAGVFTLFANGNRSTVFLGGLSAGFEWLFGGTWGLRVWTGIQVLYRDVAMYEIPLRWGFTGYF